MLRPVTTLALLLVALLVGVAAGCGGDDDDAGGASSDAAETSSSHTDASAEELEVWQTDLNAVGCWAGEVDGTLGPQTEAAIKEFQEASDLTVDGLLGPQTEEALKDAASSGATVCVAASRGSGGAAEGSASLTGALVSNEFTVTACTNEGETDLGLEAEVDAFVLSVDAPDGTGTLTYTGGDEQDGVDLAGTVSSVVVGDDGTFTVEGTWDSDEGESFTLTGSCTG